MTHLSREGAHAYLDISRWCFFVGLISWSQLLDRLAALARLAEPSDSSCTHAQRILRLEEHPPEDDWLNGGQNQDVSSEPAETGPAKPPDDDGVLRLIPDGRTGLRGWQFNLYDDDFFPSVPHGHARQGPPPRKLDCYLGWVYHGARQTSREPRWKIVALWNDLAFRRAASAAIDYFIVHHPSYRWRVVNPRRLPRRR
jgi:hypothetical protein